MDNKPARLLIFSNFMTKAELIDELRKGQRWLRAGERREDKAAKSFRRLEAELKNLNVSTLRDAEVSRLQELLETTRQVAALPRILLGEPYKLVRAVFHPTQIKKNSDYEGYRISLDLILNRDDIWSHRIPARGVGVYEDSSNEPEPLILDDGRLQFSGDGGEPLLDLRGRAIRPGEWFPFFSDGVKTQTGNEMYTCGKVITLLEGALRA